MFDQFGSSSRLIARIPTWIWWALLIDIAILTLTSVPFLFGRHLTGFLLLSHMAASGVMVVLLPLMVATFFSRGPITPSSTIQWLFAAFVIASWLSIAAMFVAMMPIAGTEAMHKIVAAHGWISYLAASLAIALVVASRRARRI